MIKNTDHIPGVLSQSYETIHTPTSTAKDLFLYVEYIGHAYCDNRYFLSRRSYAHFLLMYVIDGEAVLANSGGHYVVAPGQAFLIESSQPHIYGAVNSLESVWVHFNGMHFKPMFDYLVSANQGHVFTLENANEFYAQFQDLVNSYMSPTPYPEIVTSARIHTLLGYLNANSAVGTKSPVDNAINYINKNFDKKISLEELAKYSCLSISHFSAIFRRSTGYSPYHYIINTRLHASRQLLSTTNLPVENIAINIGFSDTSAFIYSFRKKYGITPYQFRKNVVYDNLLQSGVLGRT